MENKSNLMVPLAIVVAGVLIAGAVFLNSKNDSASVPNGDGTGSEEVNLDPITDKDHIVGNPDAPIIFVEYSDLECPFCKDAHDVMNQIIDKYGKTGEVAWVYRHFPITTIHPKAVREAEATECAAELGGNTAFWDYTNKIFEITPSNNGLDLDRLPEVAEEIGLDRAQFETCLDSGRTRPNVEEDADGARRAGARGTPHFIVSTKSGELITVPGFLPFNQMDGLVQQLLQLEAGTDNTGTTTTEDEVQE